jgi:hypothetical protein
MKKLSLNIDELRIESFATGTAQEARGTVHGEQISGGPTCFGQATCIVCTRHECLDPSEPGYATIVNGVCIRC